MPFSYFYVTVESNDKDNHNISVYSEIAGSTILLIWKDSSINSSDLDVLSGSTSELLDNITPDPTAENIVLSMKLANPQPFAEHSADDTALDATAFYGIVPTVSSRQSDHIFMLNYTFKIIHCLSDERL